MPAAPAGSADPAPASRPGGETKPSEPGPAEAADSLGTFFEQIFQRRVLRRQIRRHPLSFAFCDSSSRVRLRSDALTSTGGSRSN